MSRKQTSVTGRDGYEITKALAYATEIISLLPERWQEFSDCCDMKKLLRAGAPASMREMATESAGHHILGAIAEMTDEDFHQLRARAKKAWNKVEAKRMARVERPASMPLIVAN